MNRSQGAAAGFMFGILISPITGIATYLLVFLLCLLSLTRNPFFEQIQRATTIFGGGHPMAWAILAMVFTCLVSVCIGLVCNWRIATTR